MLSVFKQFKSIIEKVTEKKIKFFRSDQGNEFKGVFATFLESEGIVHQLGTAYDHTHPAKCERMHQTIMRMGRTLLLESQLPLKFIQKHS